MCNHCHRSVCVCVAVAGQAAAILWRVATDCDKAKLEVAKAGAVAPAVALLKRARQDAPAATQVTAPLCACPFRSSLCFQALLQDMPCVTDCDASRKSCGQFHYIALQTIF